MSHIDDLLFEVAGLLFLTIPRLRLSGVLLLSIVLMMKHGIRGVV